MNSKNTNFSIGDLVILEVAGEKKKGCIKRINDDGTYQIVFGDSMICQRCAYSLKK